MPGKINAKVIWEDNPDTSLVATNLSKSIDIIAESKFIEYTNSTLDYSSWADYSFTTRPAPSSIYVDKILYISDTNKYIKGIFDVLGIPIFIEEGFSVPFNKLLKIKPNTKIGMSYVNIVGKTIYLNYDFGPNNTFISNESLLLGEDFSPNMRYNLYLYNTTKLGDYCQVKIVSEYDDEYNTSGWKQGTSDPGSPTGYTVIAIRKIGGFKTNSSGNIDPDSLWDLTTYKIEVISQKYKILDNSGVRDFVASDIKIENALRLFVATNIEGALTDVKTNVNQLYNDMYYTDERSGVDLEYSIFTKIDNVITPVELNSNSLTLPLRITPGYINIDGKRITVQSPIYLGDKSNYMRINAYGTAVNNIQLGSTPENPWSANTNSPVIYPGLWRVYINSNGQIIFREGDSGAPIFINSSTRRGWYFTDGSRCIGKFRVKSTSEAFFIERMSVTNTFDNNVPKNSIHVIHGTLCPDGLFLCDGRWHDITGKIQVAYPNMPAPSSSEWQDSWWVQTPNMYNRQIKMFDESSFSLINTSTTEKIIPQSAFKWQAISGNNSFVSVISGSSLECGAAAGSSEHTHSISHKHASNGSGWTLEITSSSNSASNHSHGADTFNTDASPASGVAVLYSGSGSPLNVSLANHKHSGYIGSGQGIHPHASSSFSGLISEPNISNSGTASSFAPYKEFLICIKL